MKIDTIQREREKERETDRKREKMMVKKGQKEYI